MKLDKRLLLFDYLTSLLGGDYSKLAAAIKDADPGRRPDGHSNYLSVLESRGSSLAYGRGQLAEYDANILRHEDAITRNRPGVRLTYFQYLAALYAETYLHRLATDDKGLLRDLRDFRARNLRDELSPVTPQDLRKAALWMATGSGKTLLAHVNLLQFRHYRPFSPDNTLLVTPSETLSRQHLEELAKSGIAAHHVVDDPSGLGLQVIEITKLYVDKRDGEAPRGGVSLPTSAFEGQNLVLVDEGHKGSTSRSDQEEERKWRDIRQNLAGQRGFTLEYSATFAQITESNDELLDEYGKCILFDYGYRRFWEDGYGKDYRVVNLKEEGAYDVDELLLAGLLVLHEQARLLADTGTELAPYLLESPLMVFVGSTVTGQVESEVLQTVRFLDRVLREPAWATDRISALLAGSSGLPADLFTHRYPYLGSLKMSAAKAYDDLCARLFHGRGRLCAHMIRRAEGEIGLRTADAAKDRYCGVVNVGNASGFFSKAVDEGDLLEGEDDHITESVFGSIEGDDSPVSFLIGSKKFIEGWSSWRVSVMGLLKVGRSAGPQVIQLFGRGVRLKGRDFCLRRSQALPGAHPEHIRLLETLHIFGLRADYMQAFNEAMVVEAGPPLVTRTLPLKLRDDVDELGLLAPSHSGYDFWDHVVVFDPSKLVQPVVIDLTPTFAVSEGVALAKTDGGSEQTDTVALPAQLVNAEEVFLEALAYKRRRSWHNVYVTRSAVAQFLEQEVQLTAPKALFAGATSRDRGLLTTAAVDAIHKGLEDFTYSQQRSHETRHLGAEPVRVDHPNFPRVRVEGKEVPAYRLEVPEDMVKAVDKLIQELASGKAELEDLTEPLPRLHIDQHLYAPLLAKESDVDERGQQQALFHQIAVRSTPSGLVESEVRFLRDLRDFWKSNGELPQWSDYEIYLLRNLPRRGVGFFQTAGFYPDFMVWLTKGDLQALAFVEPHGMVNWDPMKVGLVADIRELGLSIPTVAYIVTSTSQESVGAIGGVIATEESLRDHYVLLQKRTGGDYVAVILEDLKRALEAVAAGQYGEGDRVTEYRLEAPAILDDSEVPDNVRFVEFLPVYTLKAAAGYFGSGEAVERQGWVRVGGRLNDGMFVARAVGRSMEPRIHDGDLCVFRRYRGGSRQGLVVLAQWAGAEDPETGGGYAVKQYRRVGDRSGGSVEIRLLSDNPAFEPIVLTPTYEDEVAVVAEFVETLKPLAS